MSNAHTLLHLHWTDFEKKVSLRTSQNGRHFFFSKVVVSYFMLVILCQLYNCLHFRKVNAFGINGMMKYAGYKIFGSRQRVALKAENR